MHKDEDVIDVEEVDGVYVPVEEPPKQRPQHRQPRQVHYTQFKNVKITNNIRTNPLILQQPPKSTLNDFVEGFNEGIHLINTFIKLIR